MTRVYFCLKSECNCVACFIRSLCPMERKIRT